LCFLLALLLLLSLSGQLLALHLQSAGVTCQLPLGQPQVLLALVDFPQEGSHFFSLSAPADGLQSGAR
jgi:hypothetical protein